MYQVDVLIQGFPGRAVCHGGLGWSTVTLLRAPGRTILVDVGAFGVRKELAKQLRARSVEPAGVTDVVLTHAHYDHSVNFTLFPNATVWIGAEELAWAARQPPGFNPLPELYVRELAASSRVRRIGYGDEFLPGLKALASPGHTPGHLLFYLTGNDVSAPFHRRCRQEPRRAALGQRRLERGFRRQQGDAPVDLVGLAGGAWHDPHSRARPEHASRCRGEAGVHRRAQCSDLGLVCRGSRADDGDRPRPCGGPRDEGGGRCPLRPCASTKP